MARRRKQNIFSPPSETELGHKEEKKIRQVDKPQLVARRYWLLVASAFLLAFFIIHYFENFRPPIVPASDYTQFSEERARKTTVELSEIGPRPSGSEALEVTAFEYLKEKIGKIKRTAKERNINRLELDIQRPSGCFDVDFISPFTDCYHKITNIVVRMGPSDKKQTDNAFLLNCHFDTQPDAPGATDDAVSCAIMLDIMEIIARGTDKLNNDIIFLFNGAEESCLQGAHGFITQHPWRHSIRAFINLEGAGAGGREILFQTGPGNAWLSDVYVNSVPYPSCSIVAQELFQSKVIPSDTDFRIFRDFGRISGLDIAYFQNSWVYHTEFDEHFRIATGDIQRTGKNILALTFGLDRSEYLAKPGQFEEQTRTVFFDLLGRVVWKCSYGFAAIVNFSSIGWVIYRIVQNSNPHLLPAVISCLAMAIIPSGLIFIYSGRLLGFQFFWYKGIWLAYGVYFISHVLFGLYLNYTRVRGDIKDRLDMANALHDAFLAIMTVLLFLAMIPQKMTGSSLYLAFLILAIKSKDIFQFLFARLTYINQVKATFYSLVLCQIPLAILHMYMTSLVLYLFVPVLGRMGAKVSDPDMAIFYASHVLYSIYTWSLAPLVYLTDWKFGNDGKRFLYRHLNVFIYYGLIILLLATTSLGTSYKFNKNMPKLRRIHATHIDQTVYTFNGSIREELSGIVIQGLDFRRTEDLPSEDEDFSRMLKIDCTSFKNYGDEACALPYIVPRYKIFTPEDARLIPAERVVFPNPIDLKMISRQLVQDNDAPRKKLRIEFELRGGSNNMALHVSPVEHYFLANSSLTHDRMILNKEIGTNTTFFATLGHGAEHPGVWKFWFELQAKWKQNLHDSERRANLEIVVVSMYNHGANQHTPELRSFRNKIHEKRENPNSNWRWLLTVVAATAEVKVYKF